ncbi:hydroxyethylthiazole kinase [Butyricicoccus sp. 1XD8-22]|nr:hydroxyethylthiazole kinase [Butyricicoccus sp. 1XD8-22]
MSLQKINGKKPLVHCITNYVVSNFTANGLLAIGASPVMADAIEEVKEMASIADSLLLNIGTLNERTIASMLAAGQSANEHHVPIVLDPVGAGATEFRTRTTLALLEQLKVSLIRCNIGELAAIAGVNWQSKGVDSGSGELDVVQTAKTIASKYNCLVIVTGETDVLTDGVQVELITGGHEKITKVTGSGCLLSAICAAMLASSNEPFTDLANLLREYKQVSELAYGPIGTLHENLLNHLERFAEGTK